jgi:hypothetical protein
MRLTTLLTLAVIAQGADAVTMEFWREANPVIHHLGSTAYLAKIALIVGVTGLAWALPRLNADWGWTGRLRRPAATGLALTMFAAGATGTLSNLWNWT